MNAQTAKTVKVFRGHSGGIECLQVENGFCFSGSYDKSIRCFNVKTAECIAIFEGHTDGGKLVSMPSYCLSLIIRYDQFIV